jgi:hypothetical protein
LVARALRESGLLAGAASKKITTDFAANRDVIIPSMRRRDLRRRHLALEVRNAGIRG